jgi:ribosomal peptide maturation radical SAM protein 1
MKSVALVSMPTLSARFPSIQLALLKPTLERAGIPAQTFSLFMYFGERVGWRVTESIADVWPSMVGEWIWTKAAFGPDLETHDQEYFQAYDHMFKAICRLAGCTVKRFQRIRDKDAPEFIDFCLEAVDWNRFSLIGFSVVFQQTLASLALAKALKQRYPNIPIVFGGASLEDDIAGELMRHCPQVDYMHCGDAEMTFPEMVRRLERGQSMEGLPGMMWRNRGKIEYAGRSPNFMAMNETPLPDFDEYFYARGEGGYEQYDDACEPMIPIETARGCWWGEKHHCTFCGLNRSGMEFRAKSPDQVVDQLDQLSRKYGILSFNAIDNIMAPEYTEKLFRRLAAHATGADAPGRPDLRAAGRGEPGHQRPEEHAQNDHRHAQRGAHQVVHVLRHQLHVQHPDAVSGRDRGGLPHAGGAGAQDRAPAAAVGHREGAGGPGIAHVRGAGDAIGAAAQARGLLRLHLSEIL